VNALCGAPILPAGITPTTATINHLVWAEKPAATAYLDGRTSRRRSIPRRWPTG
jgi:hypothetical protein